ncbi:MAG: cation-transporting P-type ATPase, partial [Bacteroidetes bacterium]|nr:cation-transporting P-type ATPase [Bacteroidota bacterium]
MAQPEPSGPSSSIDQVSDLMNQPALQAPWAEAPDDVRDALASTASGLSDAEVDRRREVFGWNRMEEPEPVRLTAIIVRQLRSLVVLLLAAAAFVALAMGDVVEAGAIGIVLVLNTAIGAAMEWRAVRSMEALREMDNIICVVVRDGESRKIPADQLVPGDIVRLEEGDL